MMMMIEANIQFIIKTLKSQFKKASPLHLLMWSAEPEDSPITTHPSYLFTFIKSNNTRLLQNNPYTSVQIRLMPHLHHLYNYVISWRFIFLFVLLLLSYVTLTGSAVSKQWLALEQTKTDNSQ